MLHSATFTLPAHHDALPVERRTKARVLVVDDTEAQRYAVVRALRNEEFEVLEARSGAEALKLAAATTLDAVVLDVNLPDLDGFEVCRRLKDASSVMLPVMHLSSTSTSASARAQGLDAGADGYLTHPFEPDVLRAAVSSLVRLKRQEAARLVQVAATSLLQEALDALADQIALIGPAGELIAVNAAWTDFGAANGFEDSEAGIGENYLEARARATGGDSAGASEVDAGLRRVLSGEVDHFETEYECHAPDEQRWFRMSARRVRRPGPVAAIVTHTNTTPEHERQQSEARFRRFVEASHDGVLAFDPVGRITYANPRIESMLGYGPGALIDRLLFELLEPAPALEARTRFARLWRGASHAAEMELRTSTGESIDVSSAESPIRDEHGEVVGILAILSDVTRRRREERVQERLVTSLQKERAHLVAIFEQAPAFIAEMQGPSYIITRTNPAYEELVGHRELLGLPLAQALPELEAQGVIALLDDVRVTGTPFVARQHPVSFARVPGHPSELRYVDIVYLRLDYGDGDPTMVAHGVDVTDHVLANERLVASEQRLRTQFAKLPVSTYLWERGDDDFNLLDCNEAALQGRPDISGMIGRPRGEIFPGAEDVRADFLRCLRDDVVVKRSATIDRGDGHHARHFDLTIGPQQPNRVLVHAVDTTARLDLEAQLRQSQKMEAVGQLAGGVAHDFNNLLTVIGAHSSFLLESLPANDPQRDDAEAIHKAGQRAAGLTRQLLAYSRQQILRPEVLDLNATVAETQQMLRRLLGEDIEIVTNLAAALPPVLADPGQIEQVIVNLAVNARDAMPGGGRLTVTTRVLAVGDNPGPAWCAVPPGTYVTLDVQDTGSGMTPEVQSRVFEPFFTTKPLGKGTGLGLSTVYGIVRQSNAFLVLESVPGVGTTFHIMLPAAGATQAHRPVQRDAHSTRGSETILLVEDEPGIRVVSARMLEQLGYHVLQAESGAAALSMARDAATPIDLVVSDAVMPGMSGAETIRLLQADRPSLRALFISGYTDDDIVRRGIATSTVGFVQKPFTASDFGRAVRDALDVPHVGTAA